MIWRATSYVLVSVEAQPPLKIFCYSYSRRGDQRRREKITRHWRHSGASFSSGCSLCSGRTQCIGGDRYRERGSPPSCWMIRTQMTHRHQSCCHGHNSSLPPSKMPARGYMSKWWNWGRGSLRRPVAAGKRRTGNKGSLEGTRCIVDRQWGKQRRQTTSKETTLCYSARQQVQLSTLWEVSIEHGDLL